MHESWHQRYIPGILLALAVTGCVRPSTHDQINNRNSAPPNPEGAGAIAAFHGLGKLAFVRDGRLYILDGQTDTLTEVAGAAPASAPAWSADGRWLVFRHAIGEAHRFMVANAATGTTREVTGDRRTGEGLGERPQPVGEPPRRVFGAANLGHSNRPAIACPFQM